MRGIVRQLLSPIGATWVLSHIVLVLLGVPFLNTAALHAMLGAGVSEGIGGSLIATGIAGLSLFLYVTFSESLRSQIAMFSKAGLSAIYSGRSVQIREVYQPRLAVAERIDLIGYGLSSFRQDYCDHFVAWSHRAKVRILLIDPDFPTKEASLADQRDREESQPEGRTRSDVLAFEKAVADLSGLKRSQFEVRRAQSIPSINVFRIDDEIFWGPYLMRQQSRNSPTLLVTRGGFLFQTLEDHFNELWKHSAPSPKL